MRLPDRRLCLPALARSWGLLHAILNGPGGDTFGKAADAQALGGCPVAFGLETPMEGRHHAFPAPPSPGSVSPGPFHDRRGVTERPQRRGRHRALDGPAKAPGAAPIRQKRRKTRLRRPCGPSAMLGRYIEISGGARCCCRSGDDLTKPGPRKKPMPPGVADRVGRSELRQLQSSGRKGTRRSRRSARCHWPGACRDCIDGSPTDRTGTSRTGRERENRGRAGRTGREHTRRRTASRLQKPGNLMRRQSCKVAVANPDISQHLPHQIDLVGWNCTSCRGILQRPSHQVDLVGRNCTSCRASRTM
jgi:hypothetical protein